ncbi:16S rRNA (guanine(527)-N(7))-methyltransferase RsmG [Mycoplasmopsis glycophila]|uniref:Ribosomal RNA small subunit methyltransferase G n=1 Tax=Mycoplasmopsis glycophila TaxID=171285 RepID=A0A449AUD4_9BACT|nr:16S rRNA (guanine(527)-N(7))-methyltransferase RsmG [Mycoplasmopsis glycophila]VEU70093.1 glucose-inhibited division protein B [Mycoplasmopsis glycophila]
MLKKEIVKQMCVEHSWDFALFEKYADLIEEKNKVMNLTGFSGERLWEEGILESLLFMLEITKDYSNSEGFSILDIGAGAGFPSIPFALTKPNVKFTIYEPIQKRVNFLNETVEKLGLQNQVKVFAKRVEEEKEKNLFDIVTARAVSDIRSLLMAGFHTVKLNGKMSLLKSINYQNELKEAQDILDKLKTKIEIMPFDHDFFERHNVIVEIQKLRSTPKEFPYLWKDIKKKTQKGK